MKSNLDHDYQAPSVEVLILQPEGVLCASGTTDNFTIDDELSW